MLRQEKAIGDYTSNEACSLQIKSLERQQMVLLIEELHTIKQYKIETLYSAVSLADRYLVYVALREKEPPCLITLAMTCVLLAAKLEESLSPSFTRMIAILVQKKQFTLTK